MGAATSLGGSFASAQLNQILHGIAPLSGFSVQLSPEGTSGLKTSLGYKFSSKLSATATFAGPAEGGAVSLEWRFRPHWSVRASVGMGAYGVPSTSIDLLWTKRY